MTRPGPALHRLLHDVLHLLGHHAEPLQEEHVVPWRLVPQTVLLGHKPEWNVDTLEYFVKESVFKFQKITENEVDDQF